MVPPVLFSNFNLGQGYNTAVNPYLNKEGEALEALNCDFSTIGALKRLPGYTAPYSDVSAANILGLYNFNNISGASVFLAVSGTSIYYLSGSSWVAGYTSLTTGKKTEFATLLDTVITANNTDVPLKSTDGQNWSTLGGSPPTAKYIITFNNSVYFLNSVGHTSRFHWSSSGTIDTWTPADTNTAGFQDVATNIGIGDEITGAAVNNNNLMIFKNYSTWKWDTFQLITLHSSVGCRAPRSIATIDDKTFWLSHKGVMMSDGGKPIRISKQVTDFISGMSDITTPVGWAYDNFYYLYIGTSNGVTNCLLVYDYDSNAWSYKSLPNQVSVAAILTSASSAVQYSYFGDTTGKVFRFRTGNDDNTSAIPFKWVSPPNFCKAPQYLKNFKNLIVYLDRTAKPGVDVSISVDFQEFIPLGTAFEAVTNFKLPPGTNGNSIRIAYASNTTIGQQSILGHVCLGDVNRGELNNVR